MALPAISLTLTPPAVIPVAPIDDYLSFAPQALPARLWAIAKFTTSSIVTLTLKRPSSPIAGKAPSQALWGQQHWFGSGLKQGRVLEIIDGTEDVNDYGAYVENYGTTLLDIYRASPDSNPASDSFKSLFNWGKDHYNTVGKAAGRQIGGGADFGAIVKQNFDLYTKWQDAKITDPSLSAFDFGYRNQNTIKATFGVKIGRDTQEAAGQYVWLGGNDVLRAAAADILAGGFGDDLIIGGSGDTDTAFGGPGQEVFRFTEGGALNVRDFRKGTDLIQLAVGLTDADVTLRFDAFTNSTQFSTAQGVIGTVYGVSPLDLSYADESQGIQRVFIAFSAAF